MATDISLLRKGSICTGHFTAMASPCEILLDHENFQQAAAQIEAAAEETWRIEKKFSRYRNDSIVQAINTTRGKPIKVDEETARLIDFSATLHRISEGSFDITSGVLRRIWTFNGTDQVPDKKSIAAIMPLVGWHKVHWENPVITLPEGMEIDFGGIGKEYAVDRVFNLLTSMTDAALLVNFGGDLRTRGPCRDGSPWRVGIEKPGTDNKAVESLSLINAGVATSGDSKRFLLKDGVRYSHIINPKTGWPMMGGPRSATIQAADCVQAGMYATLALLAGSDAETFLRQQVGISAWLIW
jgi:thiamine biosynthesis lipoprotein